jgi:rhodanese-related sulfurtransferase/rubrerythrin
MGLKSMSAEQLRQLIKTHHEKNYVLVDVRQPEEYRRGHIPGARLLPLRDFVQSINQLPTDKEVVLYCHGGGRSMAAAVMLEEEAPHASIANLTGGMLAWDGVRLADSPQVRLFEGQTRTQMLKTAMDLEKGAQRFYEAVASAHDGKPWAQVFARLAKAEVAHARSVYAFRRRDEAHLAPFEELFEQCQGEVLEGGMTLKTALEQLSQVPEDACLRMVEMGLQIEYAAYDLYRTLSDHSDVDETTRQAFISLAQAEKAHLQILIDTTVQCADDA